MHHYVSTDWIPILQIQDPSVFNKSVTVDQNMQYLAFVSFLMEGMCLQIILTL